MSRREYSPPKANEDAVSDLVTELYVKVREAVHGDPKAREDARKLCRQILARLG